MTAFSDRLVEANRATWTAMAAHPFVLGLADGTLPDASLRAWVQQDRVFVLEERRVVAALRAHGPPDGLDRLLAGLDGDVAAGMGARIERHECRPAEEQDEKQARDDHAKHGCLTTSQATESNAPRTRRLLVSPNDSAVGPPRAAMLVYGHCGHAFIRQGLLSSHTLLPPRSAVDDCFTWHYASALP